jgi:TPR repeat protein
MKRWIVAALVFACPVQAGTVREALTAIAQGQYPQAAATFYSLAQQDDLTAAYNLSVLFVLGQGVVQSDVDAAYWAWRAFLSRLPDAGPLAELTLTTLDDPERDTVAKRLTEWLEPGAIAGDGQRLLALAVVKAIVQPTPDLMAAHSLQSLAAALGHPGAAEARNRTLLQMPPSERPLAQDAAIAGFREWCAKQEDGTTTSCAISVLPPAETQAAD